MMECTVDDCQKTVLRRGLCSMHHFRLLRYGDLSRKRQRRPIEERFWPKVQKTETCWLWTGALKSGGYGQFFAEKYALAHRVAYELVVGPIPEGLTLDHLCRVHNCVNPAHLEPVTNGENLRRGMGPTGIHARATHCPKGHEYTVENTYRNKKGWRTCRACRVREGAKTRRRSRTQPESHR